MKFFIENYNISHGKDRKTIEFVKKTLYLKKKNVAKNITTVITVKYRTWSMIIVYTPTNNTNISDFI